MGVCHQQKLKPKTNESLKKASYANENQTASTNTSESKYKSDQKINEESVDSTSKAQNSNEKQENPLPIIKDLNLVDQFDPTKAIIFDPQTIKNAGFNNMEFAQFQNSIMQVDKDIDDEFDDNFLNEIKATIELIPNFQSPLAKQFTQIIEQSPSKETSLRNSFSYQ